MIFIQITMEMKCLISFIIYITVKYELFIDCCIIPRNYLKVLNETLKI